MSSEELVAGFKNALDRGQSIEDAKRSFINAGYAQKEIQEASQQVNQGNSSFVQQQTSSPEEISSQAKNPLIKLPGKKSVSKKKIIILSLILTIVLIGLGSSIYFLQFSH